MYNSIVSPQSYSLVQVHEGAEVTPCKSTRKRRYRSSFRFSTMKRLKQARQSKKKAARDSVKRILSFPEMNDEMGNKEGSLTLDGITEIEEEKDGEDEPANIIVVSNMSSQTTILVKFYRVIGRHFD